MREDQKDMKMIRSLRSGDVYSLVMTLAVIEIGHENAIKNLSIKFLQHLHQPQNFDMFKSLFLQKLMLKFKDKSQSPFLLKRIYRGIKHIIGFKVDPLEDCYDFICLFERTITVQNKRPEIEHVVNCLKRIILNAQLEDELFNKQDKENQFRDKLEELIKSQKSLIYDIQNTLNQEEEDTSNEDQDDQYARQMFFFNSKKVDQKFFEEDYYYQSDEVDQWEKSLNDLYKFKSV